MDVTKIKKSLRHSKPGGTKNIDLPSFSIFQRRYSSQRISDVRFFFFKNKPDALPVNDEPKALDTYTTGRSEEAPIETGYPIDTNAIEIKERYNQLEDKYLKLISEINNFKNENEKLKLLAYKSYNDLKEEAAYDLSRASLEKDSLLILMELKENEQLSYMELQDRITRPGNLFRRLSELFYVNFITSDEKNGDFSITFQGIEFLEKRGL